MSTTGEIFEDKTNCNGVNKTMSPEEKELQEISKLILEPPEGVMDISTEGSEVRQFYKGKSVFITGATGFLGKILLEKLLRVCIEIDTIYILIREKKGKDIQERINEICRDVIFGPLSKVQPKFSEKIVGIKGDAGLSEMGISPADRETIKERVSIIIHGAATVRFDEEIKKAILTNVRSTRDILELAKQCKKLESFVHVSTAYSNCIKKEIDEVFYEPLYDTDSIMKMVDCVPEEILNRITPTLLGKYPNTYALSKATAEQTVQQYGKGLPLCVFRPSIVVSTYKEPLRSWIDNLYGPTGVCASASVGVLRSLYCDPDVAADMVPVDLTVNAMIVASYKISQNQGKSDCIPIYNYVSSTENRITWSTYMETIQKYGYSYPSVHAIWYYDFKLNKNKYIHWLYVIFLHFTTALFLDGAAIITGRKPQLVKLYKKIHKFTDAISYFSMQEWIFSNYNTQKLWKETSEVDRKIFPFSIKEMEWEYYSETNLLGMRIYLLKDDISTVFEARRKFKRLKIQHYAVRYLVLLLVVKLVAYFWF